jgi:hypothetical protein
MTSKRAGNGKSNGNDKSNGNGKSNGRGTDNGNSKGEMRGFFAALRMTRVVGCAD